VAGLVPFNVEKPLASRCVRPCDAAQEREMEAKNPARLHTGSRVLITLDFLARLAVIEAEKEIREAQDQDFARDRVERISGRALPWTLAPVARPTLPDEALEVDLLAPVDRAFMKRSAVTAQVDSNDPDES
jgi:hypothetical protein